LAIVEIKRIRIRDGNEADLQADKLLDNEPINPDDTKKFGIKQKDGSILWMATTSGPNQAAMVGAGANQAVLASEKGVTIPTTEQLNTRASCSHHDSFTDIGGATGFTFSLIALVNAVRHPSGLWEIKFDGRIETNTSNSTSYNYGIDLQKLRNAIGMPNTSIFKGSRLKYTLASGIENTAAEVFSGALTISEGGSQLSFGRYYATDGTFGLWGSNTATVIAGTYLCGTIWFYEV